ncbi:MAG: phenylalanine--tRNA ligase subunit alpha, partial [Longimicrobiales bacterium]
MDDRAQALINQLEAVEREAKANIPAAGTAQELEAFRIKLLGRKEGQLTTLMRALGGLSNEDRPHVGAAFNRVKGVIADLLDARTAQLEAAQGAGASREDLTLPGRRTWQGGRHPVTQVVAEICHVLEQLGFTRARGPEVESDWYNFTSLNTPLDHPSADMHDTFYLTSGLLLRSHTSPVQIRTMQQYQPPIRVVIPGMVYRRDPFDASHAPGFEQLEGLA